jgi:6-phosphogluconolactonase
VHIFWGDERYVPPGDPHSNYHLAREALQDAVPCPTENVHPMPTELPDPDAAARDYEKTLRTHLSKDWPRFDLVL